MKMQYTNHYESPLGGVTLGSDGEALTGLWFDGQKYFADTFGKEHEEKGLPIFAETDGWISTLAEGHRILRRSFTCSARISAKPCGRSC